MRTPDNLLALGTSTVAFGTAWVSSVWAQAAPVLETGGIAAAALGVVALSIRAFGSAWEAWLAYKRDKLANDHLREKIADLQDRVASLRDQLGDDAPPSSGLHRPE